MDSNAVPLGTKRVNPDEGKSSTELTKGFNFGTLKNDTKVPI
jgi:hypothetical protein